MEDLPTTKLYIHIICGGSLLIVEEADEGPLGLDASLEHAADRAQLGEPCPICGGKLTRDTLRPARL